MRTILTLLLLIAVCSAQCYKTNDDGTVTTKECESLEECFAMCTSVIYSCTSSLSTSSSCQDCWTVFPPEIYTPEVLNRLQPYVGANCYVECAKNLPTEEVKMKYKRKLVDFCNNCIEAKTDACGALGAGYVAV